ncbi:uncharacterized protein LOC141847595 [Curcuma longa]|uniref:uncharacterized protein LOC141847595 n=1 Tax=Curcuma longa TaxID=136217 RepID=UPI003D9F3B4C
MAVASASFRFSLCPLPSSSSSRKSTRWNLGKRGLPSSSLFLRCSSASDGSKRISDQSSWESKDSDGKDYLYRLGQEADNMNISVGARQGVIDDLFVGNFLGKDSDIVFDYRQKATRSFEYLQGDYYIAPAFLDKVGKIYQTLLWIYDSWDLRRYHFCIERVVNLFLGPIASRYLHGGQIYRSAQCPTRDPAANSTGHGGDAHSELCGSWQGRLRVRGMPKT